MNKEYEKQYNCPLSRLRSDLERIFGKESDFRRHLNNSRIELLKAVRSIIDTRIDNLEEKSESKDR